MVDLHPMMTTLATLVVSMMMYKLLHRAVSVHSLNPYIYIHINDFLTISVSKVSIASSIYGAM